MAADPKFPRGAIPTPRHRLLRAHTFRPAATPPAEFATVPKKLDMWGNDQYGDCVTAQEAFAKAVWSVQCGLPETFIPTENVISWARQHGFLNGANLDEVMTAMARQGLTADDGKTYQDGPYSGVDYSDENILKAAIFQGPVNIGMAADSLPSGAGNQSGWYAIKADPSSNEDHCCAFCGYGSAAFLYKSLYDAGLIGSPTPPAAVSPNLQGYLFYTWKTIGFVTHDWIMGTVGEAWVRVPTTPGQTPQPIPPGPTPIPPGPTPIPPGPNTFWHDLLQLVLDLASGNLAAVWSDILKLFGDLASGKTKLKAGVSYWQLIQDVLKLIKDVKAMNFAAILIDIQAIIADVEG